MSARSGSPAAAADRDAAPVLEALMGLGQIASLKVRGGSMRPALQDGDLALVSPFLGLPRPGQIVLARRSGTLLAHRLVGVTMRDGRRRYRLQGDAEPAPDGEVQREDLIGCVRALLRQGRRIEVDGSPGALRRVRIARALRRRARSLIVLGAALLAAALGLAGWARAADQEATVAPAPQYRFAPGDVLSLRIWNGERIDEQKLTVQSDGEAFLPIMGIGSLSVAGQTSAEVKQALEQRLRGIYKETYVELLVTKYGGHLVHLMGEVRTTARTDSGPGEWALKGPTRLVSFLSDHGGPGPDADLMRILIIRPGDRREVNLFRAVFQGAAEDDPELQSGDLIFVPSLSMGNRKVFVLGEVNSPGVVNIIDKMGLVEAIARAGGFTQKGYLKGVVVLKRGADGQAEMRVANFKEMVRNGNLKADVPLQPGDIVFVPRRAIATLQEVFSIITPALGIIESIYIIDNFRKN